MRKKRILSAAKSRVKIRARRPLWIEMRLSLKAPWKLAIDARVENNGTVFLVYPFTDFAREWLNEDKNLPRGSRRLGDIVLGNRAVILRLVARMVDGDLWVVWR